MNRVSKSSFAITRVPGAVLLASVVMTAALGAMQTKPATAPPPVTLPAGTTVNVRLTQDIDVDLAQTGMTFKVRVDDPVSIEGRIVIPREASGVVQAVKVAQSGAFKGSDHISLKLNTISVGGRVYQVATDYATVEGKGEGKRTARKAGGGAGLGAIVGGIAGGGEGALVGGLVGGIAGTAVAASGEEHLRLPAETRLKFKLASSVRIEM
jgi:hypothetical protein